ncbi:MAG: prepilin-type N-terminal cleavage/methylation domain-containing protein [Methylococcales bacterium]|nr:prepilin-type N-terminal cleavage/methylation domain-containing protein [Methylococcales bacterium]
MVRQAPGNCSMRYPTSCMPDTAGQALNAVDHERNQQFTVRPELVEGLNQQFFKRQRGVTLIELVLSMVIISIALVGILSVINLTVRHSADPVIEHQALAIAESYLEEISLQAYSGSASIDRANFDDVSDYNGLNDNGVHDQQGNAVSGLSQYTVSVVVSAATALTGSVNAKQITVSVSGPGVPSLTLVGYKADY